jgi:hypothetical protein
MTFSVGGQAVVEVTACLGRDGCRASLIQPLIRTFVGAVGITGPVWLTVTVFPATVSVPFRLEEVPLAATV